MARYRYSKVAIIGKLTAAGLAGYRDRSVIRAEMEVIEARLRRLKAEYHRVASREAMNRLRADPEFESKRRAGYARMVGTPEYIEKRREVARRCPQPLRLPSMTEKQRRVYEKLRYKHKQPRDIALAAVMA